MKRKLLFLGLLVGVTTACTPSQLAAAYADGQLFCSRATTAGPLVVAIATTLGAPVLVTGLASGVVAAACKAWDAGAVPVSPPTTTVPTVAIVSPTT